MRLVCPNCASQYEVDGSLFPDEGREVQCSNCEEVWVQSPVQPDPPMRLDALTAVAGAARPSDRLGSDERDALASAVAEEVDARGGGGLRRRGGFSDSGAQADDMDDREIVKALRDQIRAEGGPMKGGEAKSQKRNLRIAAEAVGVNVDEDENDPEARKWNISSHEESGGRKRDGLKAAIERYEEELGPMRPKRRVRTGFMTILTLLVLGAIVYIARPQIADAVPAAAPYLDQYVDLVDQGRVRAEELYVEYQPIVMAKIAEFTGGGEAPTEGAASQ